MPSRKDWPIIMQKIADERIAISAAKNANYSGGDPDDDAFMNFDLVEILTHGALTREQGIFVRMCDKVSRLGNLLWGEPDAVGESVEDTLKDLANYSDILLQAYRETCGNYGTAAPEIIERENPQIPLPFERTDDGVPVVEAEVLAHPERHNWFRDLFAAQ